MHYLRWVEIQLSVNPQSPLIPINSNDELDDKLNSVDFVDFMDNPLINHADNEGYYLPVDFDEVLFDDVENQSIGSSYHLMAVLQDSAPHLGISLVDGKLTDEEIARLTQRIDDYKQNMGAVSGVVGLFGGLGGFILPIMFGAAVDITGIRSSAFMIMFGVVWVSLIWIYFAEVKPKMEQDHRPKSIK